MTLGASLPLPDLFEPLSFSRGPAMKNRFMLAPMTNQQSHADGRLSEEELAWLTMRAAGGFGLVMTAASHVQAVGQGFPGQVGIFSDEHVEGLSRLAATLRAQGCLSAVQLHQAGNRAPKALVGAPVCPSDDPETGARGLRSAEVEQLRDDFISAAKRAERAGFDGVEVHAAHGYILAQFLSAEVNRRDDRYGGSLENRARLLLEIVNGVRSACRPDFQIGVRLSPERYGQRLADIRQVSAELLQQQTIDYLDLSLWDTTKSPEDPIYGDATLLSHFTNLPRGTVRLGAAGKVMSAKAARTVIQSGCDFVAIGRGAILRHDFPRRVRRDENYNSPALPIPVSHLLEEGLSPPFVAYMRTWPGFVLD